MKTTMDAAGRVIIPASIRDRLLLHGGSEVDVIERGGIIEIVPCPHEIRVVDGPRGPAAETSDPAQSQLTDAVVRSVIDRQRR